ncbi:MAG: DUF3311 domain-containing protein [Jatrophihabitans sp.]
MPDPGPSRPPKLSRATATVVAVLLLIPCAALAVVPLYSREKPVLWGWPFFYWYQVAWVLITPILTYTAYVIVQRARGNR